MNAVNLLPEKNRPRKASSGGQGRGAYIALGVLGAVLVGLLAYVLTLNSINSSKTQITEAKAEATRLEAQANSLGPYGDFAKIKAERVASVQQLAQGRFDWERLVRELSHVLPTDVWLVNASAAASGDNPAGGSTAPTAPGAAASLNPTLSLQGCARDQSQVAVTLVRLKELQGATDVSLEHSTAGTDTTAGSSASTPAPATDAAASDTGCGTTHGKANYSFQANVTFAVPADPAPGKVPSRLGGGA